MTVSRRLVAIGAGPLGLCIVLLLHSCTQVYAMDIDTRVFRVPPGDIDMDGPDLVVSPGDADASVQELYRRAAREDVEVHAGEPALAFLRTPILSHKDEVEVQSARRRGNEISLVLDLQVFGGALAASADRVGLVRMNLGPLRRGTYTIEAIVRTRPSVPEGGPTPVADPSQTVSSLQFQVR